MVGRRLEFFFDYASPFGYLASAAVPDLVARHGAELVYKPILLGALFKAIGTPMVPIDEMSDAKRRYIRSDMQRWAAVRGVPLSWPSRFPLRTVKPLRMTILAEDESSRVRLIDSLMRACWVEDRDPNDDDVLSECARRAGVDPGLVDRARSDEAKAALRRLTDEAITRDVPGVPTFFVDDELFWGQDRLHFVERALGALAPMEDSA